MTSFRTALFRLPGGSTVAVCRLRGSRHPGRTSTSTAVATAAAQADRASIAARSGGVWVATASAFTKSRIQSGSASVGNAGRSDAWNGTGNFQPRSSGGFFDTSARELLGDASTSARYSSTFLIHLQHLRTRPFLKIRIRSTCRQPSSGGRPPTSEAQERPSSSGDCRSTSAPWGRGPTARGHTS